MAFQFYNFLTRLLSCNVGLDDHLIDMAPNDDDPAPSKVFYLACSYAVY